MRIAVFDYGAGNLHSLCKALELTGATVAVEADVARCAEASLLVLPGVGAFGQAASRLARSRALLRDAVAGGLPVLGICLGMQLLFDESEESPGAGLGIVAGRVTRVAARRVPHIGWNTLEGARDPALERHALTMPYFAHSFACRPANEGNVVAWCSHETDRFPALLRAGPVTGIQFHPEKSGTAGVAFLVTVAREAMCS